MKKILISTTILAAATYSAQAADPIMPHDVVPVVYDHGHSWTGGYLGFHTGYQHARFKEYFNGNYEYFNGDYHMRNKSDGILAGIYGGYNFELWNKVMLGIDADVTYNTARKNVAYTAIIGQNTSHDFNHETKLEWSAALRARLGYAMDRWMPYIAGGVATASLKNAIYDTTYNYPSNRSNMTGWTAGVGVDYAMAMNTMLRLEYRHTDYGRKTFSFDNFSYRTKVRTDEIRIGVAYRF